MQTAPNPSDAPGLFDKDIETLQEIFIIESRKTRNKLLTAAIVIAGFDMIAYARADLLNLENLFWIVLVPVILVALAFLALKEPIVAILLAMGILAAIWIIIAVTSGLASLLSGWLAKSILIYLLLAGLQNAREAARVKKEMLQP